jgi:hypothetical protein
MQPFQVPENCPQGDSSPHKVVVACRAALNQASLWSLKPDMMSTSSLRHFLITKNTQLDYKFGCYLHFSLLILINETNWFKTRKAARHHCYYITDGGVHDQQATLPILTLCNSCLSFYGCVSNSWPSCMHVKASMWILLWEPFIIYALQMNTRLYPHYMVHYTRLIVVTLLHMYTHYYLIFCVRFILINTTTQSGC